MVSVFGRAGLVSLTTDHLVSFITHTLTSGRKELRAQHEEQP